MGKNYIVVSIISLLVGALAVSLYQLQVNGRQLTLSQQAEENVNISVTPTTIEEVASPSIAPSNTPVQVSSVSPAPTISQSPNQNNSAIQQRISEIEAELERLAVESQEFQAEIDKLNTLDPLDDRRLYFTYYQRRIRENQARIDELNKERSQLLATTN